MQPTITTDTTCRDVLQQYASGAIEEMAARQLIAASLHASGIARTVAREKTVQNPQLRDDLQADMEELLYRKIMQSEAGGFDLTLALNTSSTAWARQLLRTARSSLLRNIHVRTGARLDLIDPVPDKDRFAETPPPISHTAFHSASVGGAGDPAEAGETFTDAADWLRSKQRHLRDSSKLSASAASIMHGYRVPAVTRPPLPERKRLKAMLDSNPELAHRSVSAMRALIESEPYPFTVDEGLLALWDNYSFDQMDAIASAPPKVAQVLVDAAVSDRARPSRNVLRLFGASVRALGTGKGWARLAAETCETFIALEFEAYSSFDTTGSEYRDERLAGRRITVLKSPEVFARVLAHPGQRLGMTENDIYEQLDRLITTMTEFDVKAPAA
ncbi:hypothetical protein LJ759_18155 [Arthrobacter sp. zg-Y1110]|uniref:hypothetical protein n=2 Tax=Arthrobacter sp. zg-Y1110 TaxID=2886932 RepID=UPI001D135CCB|nr:hypothetical protein [Arthrobacter sp. zg-Y1110]MCC3292846.1 hypothetical protein [Arthrobacter sp. zg-Y1110]